MKRQLMAVLSALLFFWSSGAMAAEIIPADRLADWTPAVAVGVPGGIPTDRTHLIDVSKAPYNADNTGKGDAQPGIQKAIADAKDKDVVYLPAGTYRLEKPIRIGYKSRFTLRGAGMGKTLLLMYSGCNPAFDLGSCAVRSGLVVSESAKVRHHRQSPTRRDGVELGRYEGAQYVPRRRNRPDRAVVAEERSETAGDAAGEF